MRNIKIIASAKYLPNNIVTSEEMDKRLNVQSGWVADKVGVKNRHFVDDETSPSMGAIVLKEALFKAGINFNDLDCLVGTCGTPAQAIPCTASLIQEAIGELDSGVPCFDINSTCLSFVTAVDMLSYAMVSKKYHRVAFVASEVASVGLNYSEKESAALFGDGAACFIFEFDESAQSGIIASHMETYSSGAHDAEILAGGSLKHPIKHKDKMSDTDFLFKMNGQKIFKLASSKLVSFCEKLFENLDYEMKDCDLVIPHQASPLALKLMCKKLEIPKDKFMVFIENCGNQIAASLPSGLHDAIESGSIKRGDTVCLLGTSAGLTIGAIVLKY